MNVIAATFAPAFFIPGLIGLVISIVAIVDVVKRPDWAWQASGQSKTLWLILNIVGLFICGLIIGLIYLLAIRPKVAAAQQGGGPMGGGPGGYGGGQYGGGQPYVGSGPGQYGATGLGQYGSGQPYVGPGAAPPPPSSLPPPGWYPDPGGSGQPRYWDGKAWAQP